MYPIQATVGETLRVQVNQTLAYARKLRKVNTKPRGMCGYLPV